MKLRYLNLSFVLLIGLVCPCNAKLVVTLSVDPNGTFDVFMRDDGTDDTAGTFGIASYAIPFVEPSSILSVNQVAPNARRNNSPDFSGIGFDPNSFPSTGDAVPSPLTIINSQPSFAFSPNWHRVGGFGQVSSNLDTATGVEVHDGLLPFITPPEQRQFSSHLHVITGTWDTSQTAPEIDVASVDFWGAVFTDPALQNNPQPVLLSAVPEPSPLILAASIFLLYTGYWACTLGWHHCPNVSSRP